MAQQAPYGSDDEVGFLALLNITVAWAELGAAEMPNSMVTVPKKVSHLPSFKLP